MKCQKAQSKKLYSGPKFKLVAFQHCTQNDIAIPFYVESEKGGQIYKFKIIRWW